MRMVLCFIICISEGYQDTVSLLLNSSSINVVSRAGLTPLMADIQLVYMNWCCISKDK